MRGAHEARIRELLALGDKLRATPLWDVPPNDRRAWLSARERQRYARWVPAEPDEAYKPSEAHTPILDFAPTE
jgi:hypothetical protein